MRLSFPLLVVSLVTSGVVIAFPVGSIQQDVHSLQPRADPPNISSSGRSPAHKRSTSGGAVLPPLSPKKHQAVYESVKQPSDVKVGTVFKFKDGTTESDFHAGEVMPQLPKNMDMVRGIVAGRKQTENGEEYFNVYLCYFWEHGITTLPPTSNGAMIYMMEDEKFCHPYIEMTFPIFATVIQVPKCLQVLDEEKRISLGTAWSIQKHWVR